MKSHGCTAVGTLPESLGLIVTLAKHVTKHVFKSINMECICVFLVFSVVESITKACSNLIGKIHHHLVVAVGVCFTSRGPRFPVNVLGSARVPVYVVPVGPVDLT